MVTHPSSPDVHVGTAPHNARLAFYGRRLLAMHFQLFVLDAAARVGPTAVSANGGFHAVPVDTRLAGPKSQRKSAPGDGTPDGLAAAVLDDAVLGRMVGYDWKIKELANWTHKMGYDARGSLVTSIYGGLAHAYVSRPPLLLPLHPPPFPRHLAPSSRAVGTAGARRWKRAARGVAGQTPAGRGPRPRACADDALRRATQPPVRPSSSGAAGGRRVRPRGPPVRSLPRSCPKRRRPPPSLPSPLLTPPPPLPCENPRASPRPSASSWPTRCPRSSPSCPRGSGPRPTGRRSACLSRVGCGGRAGRSVWRAPERRERVWSGSRFERRGRL